MKQLARHLRKNQTEAEERLWYFLRNRRFSSFKFRRQYEIKPFVVDFCCFERKLVLEIDGGQHSEQRELDQNRTRYLEDKGYRVLRFWNDEVLKDTQAVLEIIRRTLISPHPGPLPEGEGNL